MPGCSAHAEKTWAGFMTGHHRATTAVVWGRRRASGVGGRRAVDAATQHIETADATRLFAELESQQGGAGRHVRRLGTTRAA